MSSRGKPLKKPSRWLLWVLLGIAVVGLAVNAWRFFQPKLSPMPQVPRTGLEPEAVEYVALAERNVEQNPDSAIDWGDLGAVLQAHGFIPEAESCYRNAERLDPSDYRWPYFLGMCRVVPSPDEALALWRRAEELAGDRPHVKLRLAEFLLDRKEQGEAAALIEEALTIAPGDARAQLAKARLLMADDKLEEARAWAEKSIAADPKKRVNRQLLVQLCRRLGDRQEQERQLAELEAIPDGHTEWADPDADAMFNLLRDRNWKLRQASGLTSSGKASEAQELLAQMAQVEHPAAGPALQLADMLLQSKQFARAEATLRQHLPRHPENERLHFQLGVAYFGQEKYDQAVAEFRRVIELKSDHVDAYYNLGHSLVKVGDPSGARDAFAEAVRLNPASAIARINLADLLIQEGREAEAREHLEIAVRQAPQERRARDLLKRVTSSEGEGPSTP